MEIPASVKAALREEGITPAGWRNIRTAFQAVGHMAKIASPEKIEELKRKADQLFSASEVSVKVPAALEIPTNWEEMELAWLKAMRSRFDHLSAAEIAILTGVSKTTLYRKFKALGLRTGRCREIPPNFIERQIEDLQAEITSIVGAVNQEVSCQTN